MDVRLPLIFLGAFMLLAGCGKADVPGVLLDEPMSRPVIVHATEMDHIETGGSGPLIQSSPSMIITSYEVAPENLQAAAEDVLAQAAAAGWELEGLSVRVGDTDLSRVWVGTKLIEQGGMRIQVSFSDTKSSTDGGHPDYGKVTIRLSGG